LPDLVTVDLGTDYFCGHKKVDQTLQAITCIPNSYDRKLAHQTHLQGHKNIDLSTSGDILWYIITGFHLLYSRTQFHPLPSLGARLSYFFNKVKEICTMEQKTLLMTKPNNMPREGGQ
jgi:hypothetical protein